MTNGQANQKMVELVELIRELRTKATPGPWIADEFCEENDQATRVGTYDGTPTYYHRTTSIAYCPTNYGDELDDAGPEIGIVAAEANAALIALVPQMADAIETLLKQQEEMREALVKARTAIQEERDCMVECATLPPEHDLATLDECTKPAVEQYDALLATIAASLTKPALEDKSQPEQQGGGRA